VKERLKTFWKNSPRTSAQEAYTKVNTKSQISSDKSLRLCSGVTNPALVVTMPEGRDSLKPRVDED
jgi:hypothetical protein